MDGGCNSSTQQIRSSIALTQPASILPTCAMNMTISRSLATAAFALLVIFCGVGSNNRSYAQAAFLSPSSIPSSSQRSLPVAPLYLKKGGTKKKKAKSNVITVNKLAFRNYEVLEKLEVGISLLGTEVKSIRDGKMNIKDGFVKANKNGRSCTLMNVHIGKHNMAGEFFNHEERRPRPLLLHKQEARRLLQKTDRAPGMTIVPLKAYWNDGNKVKFEIGLCRGKNLRDKRQDIMARESKREESRMIKNFNIR